MNRIVDNLLWIVITCVILPLGTVRADGVKDVDDGRRDEECVTCHQRMWDDAMSKPFIHKPFLEKKCHFCHIADEKGLEQARGFMTDRDVDWLASRRVGATSHWFFLDAGEVGKTVQVDIQIPGKKNLRREISLPPLDDLPVLTNAGRPPGISGVKVAAVERGLFLTATIVWKTSTGCTSQVVYGINELSRRTKKDTALTTDHLVVLSGLKPRRTYRFKVVSTDLFGNTAESAPMRFSTFDPAGGHATVRRRGDLKNDGRLRVKPRLYRYGGQYVFQFTATRPVLVALGVKKDSDAALSGATTGPPPDKHRLKDALVTNNTICEPCHGVYVKGRNHPVNVPPKPGMTIPEDYFVLNNGNITCMSCHAAHASEYEYRLVRSNKRELCVGCHQEKM